MRRALSSAPGSLRSIVSRGTPCKPTLAFHAGFALAGARETEQDPSQQASKPANQDICPIADAVSESELSKLEHYNQEAKAGHQLLFSGREETFIPLAPASFWPGHKRSERQCAK